MIRKSTLAVRTLARNVTVLLIGLTLNVRAADPAADLTLEDIAAAVAAARSQVEDLSVVFTYNAVREEPNNLFYHSLMNVQVKGEKIAYTHIYSSALADRRQFGRQIAFNGKQTTTYDRRAGTADVRIARSDETSTKGMGFFDLMLWNRPQLGAIAAGDMDLATMLRLPDAQLRPRTEAIRGTTCHVVDVRWPGTTKTMVTVWLDAARGFLPLRHVWFLGRDQNKVTMEFDVEDAAEVPPGIWCGITGRKVLHADGGLIKQECEWRMVVDRESDGRPWIKLNRGVDDGVFEPWRTLPPGTMLIDGQVGRAATVGGKDYEALVKGLDLSLAAANLSIAERGHRQAGPAAGPPLGSVPAPTDGRSAWFWGAIVLVVIAVGGCAMQLWRRKSQHE